MKCFSSMMNLVKHIIIIKSKLPHGIQLIRCLMLPSFRLYRTSLDKIHKSYCNSSYLIWFHKNRSSNVRMWISISNQCLALSISIYHTFGKWIQYFFCMNPYFHVSKFEFYMTSVGGLKKVLHWIDIMEKDVWPL